VRVAGEHWRVQQKATRATESTIESLVRYRANTTGLSLGVGGVKLLGQGVSAMVRDNDFSTRGSFSTSVTAGALAALSDHFDVGGVFSKAVHPVRRALNETADVTTQLARLGANVTPEMRKAIFDIHHAAEKRVQDEQIELQKLGERESVEAVGSDSRLGPAIDRLSEVLTSLERLLERLF
jgi:hypothetical protein